MRIVVSYRGIPQSPGWATGDSVVRALRKLGHEVYAYGNYYQTKKWLSSPAQGNPVTDGRCAVPITDDTLLIHMECNDADPQYRELLEWPCRKVMWDFDTAMHEGATRELAAHFDHVFLANPRYLDIPRSSYLPYAFDPQLMRAKQQKRNGAAIIGSAFPARAAFAREVGVPIISNVYRQEYVDAVAGLRVHVHNMSSGGDGLLVMRVWETMGLGTCFLAPVSDDTMKRHFVPGRHYALYGDDVDCRSALGRLLDNGTAEEIAAAGQREVLAHHTYLHRVQELLAAL